MLRLFIMVNDKFYYDIGLRKDNYTLSKTTERFGELSPRYLEDFIEKFDRKNVHILDYGCLDTEKEYIDKLLEG